MKKIATKNQYLYIYLFIVVLFSLFYAVLFATNRIQYINHNLESQRQEIFETIKSGVNLNEVIDARQLQYINNYIRLLELLYYNKENYIDKILKQNVVYDFIGIIGLDGKYKYANNFDFKQLHRFKNTATNAIASYTAYDFTNNKTYKIFSYPLVRDEKLEGYIVIYLDIDFLLDFDGIYLVSAEGNLLNSSYINDVYVGHRTIPDIYPEAWKKITQKEEGQFITNSTLFTFKTLNLTSRIKSNKIETKKYYFISIIAMNPNDNPYNIKSFRAFIKYSDFRAQISYWIIGYIWILFTSVFFFIFIINKIKSDYLNNFDVMTGVYNRRKGFIMLESLIRKYNFASKNIFANIITGLLYLKRPVNSIHICLLDVDNLKQVNDKLGHKYGDELIISVISGVNKYLKKSEFIIRIGGDEFIVVFINRRLQDIKETWQQISKEYEEINNSGVVRYNIRASKGIFEYKAGMDIESCIAEADRLMYQEKRRHKVSLFFP